MRVIGKDSFVFFVDKCECVNAHFNFFNFLLLHLFERWKRKSEHKVPRLWVEEVEVFQ